MVHPVLPDGSPWRPILTAFDDHGALAPDARQRFACDSRASRSRSPVGQVSPWGAYNAPTRRVSAREGSGATPREGSVLRRHRSAHSCQRSVQARGAHTQPPPLYGYSCRARPAMATDLVPTELGGVQRPRAAAWAPGGARVPGSRGGKPPNSRRCEGRTHPRASGSLFITPFPPLRSAVGGPPTGRFCIPTRWPAPSRGQDLVRYGRRRRGWVRGPLCAW